MSTKSNQKIVDAHLHWWDLESNYYPWLTDQKADEGGLSGTESLARTYLYEHYLEDAQGYDIRGFVHIQAEWNPADPVGETRWLQGLVDQGALGGLPLGIVGFANFADDNVEAVLEGHAAHANARGIRHMLNHLPDNPALCWANEDFMENAAWIEKFGLLKKYGLDFDLMCFSNHMERAAALAGKHPETRIILEHTGMPHDHTPEGRDHWRSGLRSLASMDNVFAKISGHGNTIENWTEELIRPYVLETIEIFGTDRVCFASNFPTDSMFSSMDAVWSAFLSITGEFSQDERDSMFAENAINIYRLPL